MIQRIQSLYLMLAMAALSLLFFFPVASVGLTENTFISVWITHYGEGFVLNTTDYWFAFFSTLSALLVIGLAFVLFSFKNRKRQVMGCKMAFFLLLLLMVGLFFGLDAMAGEIRPEPKVAGIVQYRWPIYLPIFSVLLLFLATKAIRKDEALIRSTDRLR